MKLRECQEPELKEGEHFNACFSFPSTWPDISKQTVATV